MLQRRGGPGIVSSCLYEQVTVHCAVLLLDDNEAKSNRQGHGATDQKPREALQAANMTKTKKQSVTGVS